MSEQATINYLGDHAYTEYAFGNCVTVVWDSVHTNITFDLGTEGCTGLDGRVRKGKIIVDYNGVPRESGSIMSISFNNYSVNGYMLTGTLSYTTLAENAEGNLEISYEVNNGMYTEPDGDMIQFESERTIEWVDGAGSEDLYDDVFETTGSFSGEVNADAYSGQNTEPVVFKTACWTEGMYYPVSGVLELDFPDALYRAVNYGEGNCDKDIVITVGNIDYEYTLP